MLGGFILADYEWILENGEIQSTPVTRSYYQLNDNDILSILTNAMNQLHNHSEVIKVEDNIFMTETSNVYSDSTRTVFCMKGVTPGGRPDKYTNEFRIQQKPSRWDRTIEIARAENIKGVLLGIYKTEDLTVPIFCAWKLQSAGKATDSPLSKQIRAETISEAITNGFAQVRTKNEYICAFRKEFIFFYLQHSTWIHDVHLTELHSFSGNEDNVELLNEPNETYNATHSLNQSGINRIYFGAPGTGKSYGIKDFIQENGIENYDDKASHPNVFRTTLHPEYGYHDFVGQVMPIVKKDEESGSSVIEYEFSPQIFTKALERAFEVRGNGEPVFLILEEMSRANVAAVFGDLFQLLDRDEHGVSEYKIDNSLVAESIFGEERMDDKIYLPENIFLLGTVNTSDQNVYVMDTAFKRRFEFEYIPTDEMVANLNNYTFTLKVNGEPKQFTWLQLVPKLNAFIIKSEEQGGLGLSEDKQLGQFFIKFKEADPDETDEEVFNQIEAYNYNQIKGKLLQYLWHDVKEASYSTHHLFREEVTSFSKLYSLAKNRDNFFSEQFLSSLE